MTARLQWPDGWPRTPADQRRKAPYKTGIGASARALEAELRLMGAANVVISTCLPARQDGLPRAGEPEPDDPGVAVYWTLGGKSHAMACDVWTRVRDNLRAVGLSIEALRGLGRWGATQVVHRAFSGFAALPAGPARVVEEWARQRLRMPPEGPVPFELRHYEERYRSLVQLYHPDKNDGEDLGTYDLNRAIAHVRERMR